MQHVFTSDDSTFEKTWSICLDHGWRDASQWFSTRCYISRRERTRSSMHGTVPNKMRRWLIDFVPLRPQSKIYALFIIAGIVHIYDIHSSYFHETRRERKTRFRIVIYLRVINLGALRIQSGYTLNRYSSIYIESVVNVAIESLFLYLRIYNKY